jgi:hypothetical protein
MTALLTTGIAALVGAWVGIAFGYLTPPELELYPVRAYEYPLPHQTPKYPGGISLRFAMVHDVLHERFASHGPAYYRERNRLVRRALEESKAARERKGKLSAREFALLDDLGVGLDSVGKHEEAVRVLREKLRLQQAQGYQGKKLYTTYANLGTFLIHGNFRQACGGNREAKKKLREGLAFIHKSIQANPQAHFGREVWQAVAVEFFLAAVDDPKLLLKYDLVGNRLDIPLNSSTGHAQKLASPMRKRLKEPRAPKDKEPDQADEDWVWEFERNADRRRYITQVGAEDFWPLAVTPSHQAPVPFDEPTLGIIGMWRLGGGANPHFALALGEIMIRVGQANIAWCAFERAARMADRFWPNPALQQGLVEHCRRRQREIEETLSPLEQAQLRPRFQAELQFGLRYQKAYQDYEKDQIGQGKSIEDPHFYDAFHRRHRSIASPVGKADTWITWRVPKYYFPYPQVIFFAGAFAFGAACFLRFWNWAHWTGIKSRSA